jgi:hypothetical protein
LGTSHEYSVTEYLRRASGMTEISEERKVKQEQDALQDVLTNERSANRHRLVHLDNPK